MAKYTITWCENKTAKSGTTYTVMTLKDETGKQYDNVSTFDKDIVNGGEIEGEVVQNGNYLNFKSQRLRAPAFIQKQRDESILKAQERKEESIHKAQDRSALMWAKYGACEIIAHHPAFKDLGMEDIIPLVEKLSTKIYNLEPTEPF